MGSETKPGWRRVRFDQLATNVNERIDNPAEADVEHYVGLEHLDSDSLRIRRWGSPSDVEATKLRFRTGDIIFGRRRVYQRKLAVADFDGICSAHAMVLRAKPDVALPEFLPFFMQSDLFMNRALEISVGSLSPTINWTALARQEFALPPLDEQRRIASLLWQYQFLEDAYYVARKDLELLLTSLTETFLAEHEESTYSVSKLLSELPKNGISPKTNSQGAGYRTVSLSAISNGKFMPQGNDKYAEVDGSRVESFFVRAGDVYVIRGNGNRCLTGKAGMAFQDYSDLFYPDLLIRLRFDQAKVSSQFAVLQWNCSSAHSRLISRAKSTNGIWKINGQDIQEHKLIVPPPEEQSAFLADINEVEKAAQMLEQRQIQCGKAKDSTLNRILTR